MNVYLDKPITIKGIKVTHTPEGLEFLIEHYQKMLQFNPVNCLTGEARSEEHTEYMKLLIVNWEQHLELYKQEGYQPKLKPDDSTKKV